MRPLRRVSPVPPKLKKYAEDNPHGTWEKFSKKAKRKQAVRDVLCDMQQGLCAYCEIDITDYDRQVEHFFPKSKSAESGGTNKHLEWENMLLCCRGGNLEGEKKVSSDVLRSEGRISDTDTYSCGTLKDNVVFDEYLNPYNWNYSLVRVKAEPVGETYDRDTGLGYDIYITPWEEHCRYAGIASEEVKKFIDALNLNGPRLLKLRGDAYQGRLKIVSETPEDEIHQRICEYLLPKNRRLRSFVSVSSHIFKARGSIIVLRYTLLEILNHLKNNKKKS